MNPVTPPAFDPARRIRELEAEVERLQTLLGLRTAAAPSPSPAAGTTVRAKPAHPLRILLADDHPIQSKMTHALLDSLGYTADVVRNGKEVLYALEKRSYDVVLMDVMMPEMNGFETTAAIRERWPANKRPRIIALTGRNLERDRSDCLAAGMDDFIGKPVALRILANKLTGRSESLVNAKVFEELAQATGKDTMKDVVEMFLRDLPRAIKDMRDAAAAGNAQTLRNVAHPQASVCHALGVLSMSLLAKQLESLADRGELAAAPALLDDLESLLAPVEIEFRRLQNDAPRPAVGPGTRILVVEDNPINLKITLSILHSLGHRADSARSGREAVRAVEQHRYGLVLMDILMPDLNGLEATRQICARWPRNERPHIVGMTGLTADADRNAGLAAGMDDYIGKPLTRQRLAATLAALGFSTVPTEPIDVSVATAPSVIPQTAAPVLDEQILNQWAQTDRQRAVAIADEFLRTLPTMLAALQTAVKTGDAPALARAAHSLKSASMGVGALATGTLAADLETRGRAGTLAGVENALAQIEALRAPLQQQLLELRQQFV